jgi:phage gp46-like protein
VAELLEPAGAPRSLPASASAGVDLALERRGFWTETGDRTPVDLRERRGDLLLAAGRANLAQSLLNRLHTRRGALAGLGHPLYGSRLHLVIGEPDSRRTRALAEYYIREALLADGRVKEVVTVTFAPPERRSSRRNVLVAHVVVQPRDGSDTITLSLATNLDG